MHEQDQNLLMLGQSSQLKTGFLDMDDDMAYSSAS